MSSPRRPRNRRKQRAARALADSGCLTYQQARSALSSPVSLAELCAVLEAPPSGPLVASRVMLVAAAEPITVTSRTPLLRLDAAQMAAEQIADALTGEASGRPSASEGRPSVIAIVDLQGAGGNGAAPASMRDLRGIAQSTGAFIVALTTSGAAPSQLRGSSAALDWADFCVGVTGERRVVALKNRYGTLLAA